VRAIRTRLLILALLVEAPLVALHALGSLRQHVPEAILLLLATNIFYLVSCFWVLKKISPCNPGDINQLGTPAIPRAGASPVLWIAGAALVFRLTVFPLAPALSDDLYRYRWEGLLQAHGGNPYQARPNDAAWSHLRDSAFDGVPGKDFKAVYGPVIERIQLWTYRVVAALIPDPVSQVFWMKLPAALADLGVIAALWALLAARGQPVERILIYAWSPLPVVEFWGSGHNDAIAVVFVVLALVAAARERWWWAFVWLALGSSAKLWPLLLFPMFIGRSGRRRAVSALIALPVCAVTAWPYWSDVWENLRFLGGFLGGWRNQDSLYGIVLWLTGDIYRAKYVTFALVAAAVLGFTLSRWPLERAALWSIAAMLMLSANCHPWYLTWMLPLAALAPSAPLLLWTALAPLSYAVLIDWEMLGVWHGSTPLRWYIYAPVYGLLIARWIARRVRT